MSLVSSTERLLVRCKETGTAEIPPVSLYGFSSIRAWFSGDAKPCSSPCSSYGSECWRGPLEHLSVVQVLI